MDGVGRGFPPGDLRVSDADRDRALSELSEAFQVGRITADEFDQRSGQALRARTGKELTALLADLPVADPPAARTSVLKSNHALTVRSVIAASAAAGGLSAFAVTNALRHGTGVQASERVRQSTRLLPYLRPVTAIAHRQGHPVWPPPKLPASPAFDWAGTITPAAIAVLLVMLIIFLRVTRADRSGT